MFSVLHSLAIYVSATRPTAIIRINRIDKWKGLWWRLNGDTRNLRTSPQNLRSPQVKNIHTNGAKTLKGDLIQPGDTVELNGGDFLRVCEVRSHPTKGGYSVTGWRFCRVKKTLGLPNSDPKEVYWVCHIAENNREKAERQILQEFHSSKVKCHRKLTLMNNLLPRVDSAQDDSIMIPTQTEHLICSWKHVIITKEGKKKRPIHAFQLEASKIAEGSLVRLSTEECDKSAALVSHDDLRTGWRGHTKKFGSSSRGADDQLSPLPSGMKETTLHDNGNQDSLLNETQGNLPKPIDHEGRRYTYGDPFCGGCGSCRGAKEAGLDHSWASDYDAAACKTFHLNFPLAKNFRMDAQDIHSMHGIDLNIDILHLSTPCQPYSPARRQRSDKDKANIAASMAIGSLLDKAKPRVATFENTSGLWERKAKTDYGVDVRNLWGEILQQFTSRGYSVRWKSIKFEQYGLPQKRRRLILVASW